MVTLSISIYDDIQQCNSCFHDKTAMTYTGMEGNVLILCVGKWLLNFYTNNYYQNNLDAFSVSGQTYIMDCNSSKLTAKLTVFLRFICWKKLLLCLHFCAIFISFHDTGHDSHKRTVIFIYQQEKIKLLLCYVTVPRLDQWHGEAMILLWQNVWQAHFLSEWWSKPSRVDPWHNNIYHTI
jgi:hypothetical protein